MKQLCKQFTAALLALLLLFGTATPALAASDGEAVGGTLRISTVRDLLDLQARCTLDTATQNLTVLLEADLDLTDSGFTGLPVFSGHFDGQGHRITGLTLPDGCVRGFVRYLEEDAILENLHVEGTGGGEDAETTEIIGLLVGSNRGLIRGCSADGSVTAAQQAGGLAGRNEETGQIINCTNRAAVQADRMAGGVAGQNLGSIVRCQNDGAINTELQDAANNVAGLNRSPDSESGTSLKAVSDIGGIAGKSGGILQSCTNTGSVGYPSVGYNVGGIVGRLSGYLNGCANSGAVQGRQDVGGVAGQLEPLLTVQYDGGALDTLYNELDALQGVMETTLSDMDAGSDSISASISALTDATKSAKDSTGALADSLADWTDDTAEAVKSTASRFSWAIDRLEPVLNNAGSALEQADAAGAALEQLLADAGVAAELGSEARADLEAAAARFAEARSQAQSALEHARAALRALQEALGSDGESDAAWSELAAALGELQTAANAVQDAAGELESLLGGMAGVPDRQQDAEALYQQLLAFQAARNALLEARNTIREQASSGSPDLEILLSAAGQALQSSAEALAAAGRMLALLDDLTASLTPAEIETLRAQIEALTAEIETARDAAQAVQDAARQLLGQAQTDETALGSAWEELQAAAASLSAAGDNLEAGAASLADAVEHLRSAAGSAGETIPDDLAALKEPVRQSAQALKNALSGIGSVLSGLTGQPSVTVPSLSGAVSEEGDALDASLDALISGFSALNTTLNSVSGTVLDDLRAVNAQLGRVVDAVRDLTDGAGDEEDILVDVSREQAQKQAEGSIVNAANTGAVEGDSRVGGIAGSLAVELDADPEGHWEYDEDKSVLNATVQLRLVLLDCQNTGAVTAKKDNAGGIAGLMDFGYAAGCENYGDVESTDGSYVGGIAGDTEGILEDCWARCALAGSEYVGGAAGRGSQIENCRTMVEITAGDSYTGAIAGTVQSDGLLSGNYYVNDSLGAVDGVSRAAQATPAAFETLAADSATPSRFAQLELTFVADGETVAVLPFRYGEGVASLPAVPSKNGCIGQWPDIDYTHLTYSQTLEAEYIPYTSALSDGSGDLPQVLVDGSFGPQAAVTTTSQEIAFTDDAGREHTGTAYTVTVTDPQFGAPDCTVHFRKPDTSARYNVYVQQDDAWVKQDAQTDGSYLLIPCTGGQITFMAVEAGSALPVVGLVLALLLLAVLFTVLWLRRCRRQRRPRKPAETAE